MLNQRMSQNEMKIWITETGIRNRSILDSYGMGLNAPLAICVESEKTAKEIFDIFSGFGSSEMIPLDLPKREFDLKVKDDYELLPVICDSKSRRNRENLESLKHAMTLKTLHGKQFYCLPVIAFCGGIPRDLTDYLSGKCVIIGEKPVNAIANREERVRNMVELVLDNLALIEHELQNLEKNNANEYFFRGAGEICKILVKQAEGVNTDMKSELIRNIERTVKDLEEGWEIVNNYVECIDLLRDIIMEKAKYIFGIVNRKAVSYSDEVTLERNPIYDENYYYLTPEFFDDICKKVPCIGTLELKRAMYDAGILVGEGVNRIYFEVKVPIKTASGVKITKRRLRIARSWLDLPGELSWKEKIELEGREKNERGRAHIRNQRIVADIPVRS